MYMDPSGAYKANSIHNYAGSWYTLHLADLATVQHYPNPMQRGVAPAQLPNVTW